MFWEDIETYIILPLSNKHAEIMIQENIICESIPKFSIGLKKQTTTLNQLSKKKRNPVLLPAL